ncbi:hypothetical protein [Rhodococcus sp. NPDC058639]|uniref:hypothetical protein n=1 Tax=Rhodococcus sp. NPDC058639 TaxID=3346570 RepID=UPI00364AFC6B
MSAEDAATRVRQTVVKGRDLNRSYVGKFLAGEADGYWRQGRIEELIPVITDPRGSWHATVTWGMTPTTPSSTQRLRIPFSADVVFVEIAPA